MCGGTAPAPWLVCCGTGARPAVRCAVLCAVLRPSVEEAIASLERLADREGVAEHALSALQRQQRQATLDVQAELAGAGVQVWGGGGDACAYGHTCVFDVSMCVLRRCSCGTKGRCAWCARCSSDGGQMHR